MVNKLQNIQAELHVPKSRRNKFGRYNYRSCEDIMNAVKPLLARFNCVLTVRDRLECPSQGWVFIVATAALFDSETGELIQSVDAMARHEDAKKGMDASQISGAASSYARKYALNGLFLIDDSQDADATNKHGMDDLKGADIEPIQERASRADIDKIRKAREAAGLSKDDVLFIVKDSPFMCREFPKDLLKNHVETLIERIQGLKK